MFRKQPRNKNEVEVGRNKMRERAKTENVVTNPAERNVSNPEPREKKCTWNLECDVISFL